MKKHLGVAVAQMNSVDDVEANFQQVVHLLNELKPHDEMDLVCFPENSLYMRIKEGEKIEGLSLDHEVFAKLQKESISRNLNLHLGSVAMQVDGKLWNASVMITPDSKPRISYEKIHLFDIDIPGQSPVRESDVYAHGSITQVLEINDWKLGQSICYDMRFAELYSQYAKQNVEMILAPSSFLVPTGKVHWHILLRARAIESQAYVVAAAQAGSHHSTKGSGTRETFGHSLVVDPWGQIIAEGAPAGPQLLKVHLDSERVHTVRRQIPMSSHRRLK